jgi:hypothetical protein
MSSVTPSANAERSASLPVYLTVERQKPRRRAMRVGVTAEGVIAIWICAVRHRSTEIAISLPTSRCLDALA